MGIGNNGMSLSLQWIRCVRPKQANSYFTFHWKISFGTDFSQAAGDITKVCQDAWIG